MIMVSLPFLSMGKESVMKLGHVLSILALFIFVLMPVFAIPIPTVSVDLPDEVFLGEEFTFTVTLDNTDALDTGYEPFLDVILPRAGADSTSGGESVDGISFISATYLGASLNVTELVFPSSGCVTHPLLTHTDLSSVNVCGTPENSFLVIELPIAGMSPDYPEVEVEITALMSEFADLSNPLTVEARGGFARGADILDNPCCDPFLISALDSDSITPIIMSIAKETNAPEYEVPGGNSYDYQFIISVDIADGETIASLDITDFMPDNLQFVRIISVVDSTGSDLLYTDNVPSGVGEDLIVTIDSVTGTPAEDDVVLTFEYLVPFDDGSGGSILDGLTGDGLYTSNTSSAVGDWSPNDPRDGATADNAVADGTCAVCPGNNAPYITSIAIQKSYAISSDNNYAGETPGDVITYVLDYQIADSFAFTSVVITDTLGDGQTFIGGSGRMTYDRSGSTQTINPIVPTTTSNSDGSTTLVFDISGALLAASHADGGDLLGACIPTGGDDSNLDCVTIDATEGTISYQVMIDEAFTNTDNGANTNIDHGDELTNEAVIEGVLLSPATLDPNPSVIQTNDTQMAFNIVSEPPTKEIYALNGTICSVPNCADQFFFPFDEITYRVQQTLPTSDFEDLQIIDFLPQSTFDAREVTTFNPVVSASVPSAGVAKYGPNDTANASIGDPTLITETIPVNNTVIFDYGTFSDDTNTSVQIDLLFTVTVLNSNFSEERLLGNVVQTQEQTTNAGLNNAEAIAAQPLQTPVIRTSKGAVATTSTTATFEPPTVGPVAFNAPGSGQSFTDLINSDGLDANGIDSDVSGLVVGDIVTFAFVVESVGSAEYGVFDIVLRDEIPDGFIIPTSGANLQLRLGTGDAVTYTSLGDGVNDLFDDGIEVDDFDETTGVCTPYNATSGANILVVTYDLELASQPGATVTNTGLVDSFSARNAGISYLQAGAIRTTADVIFGEADIDEDDDDEDELLTADIIATETALTILATQTAGGINTTINTNGSSGDGNSTNQTLSQADGFATQQALLDRIETLPALGQSPWQPFRQMMFVTLGILLGIIFIGASWFVVKRHSHSCVSTDV